MRLYPPGSDSPFDGSRLKRFIKVDMQYIKHDDLKEEYLQDRLG